MRKLLVAEGAAGNAAGHGIVAALGDRRAFAATSSAVTIEHIDGLWPKDLEKMTSWLLKRDGYTIERSHGGPNDQSADVIAVSSHGKRIVLQCKSLPDPKARVGPGALHALNGTAFQMSMHVFTWVFIVDGVVGSRRGRSVGGEAESEPVDSAGVGPRARVRTARRAALGSVSGPVVRRR